MYMDGWWQSSIVGLLVTICYMATTCVMAYHRGKVKHCPDQLREGPNKNIHLLKHDSDIKNAFDAYQNYLFNKTNVVYNDASLVDVAYKKTEIDSDDDNSVSYSLELLLNVPRSPTELNGVLKCCVILSHIGENVEISDLSRVINQRGNNYLIKQWMCGPVDDTKKE